MSQSVLVVDDDPGVRALIRRVLSAQKYEVVAVATAEEALHCLRNDLPSLVIIDLRLPGMSGVQLVQIIRDRLYDMAPPALLVSASLDDLVEGELELFDAWLAKPFRLPAFRRIVAQLADEGSARRKKSGAKMAAVVEQTLDEVANGTDG